MRSARRSLTADDVDDVLAVVSESAAIIDDNLQKTAEHQTRLAEARSMLTDLAQRLREGGDG